MHPLACTGLISAMPATPANAATVRTDYAARGRLVLDRAKAQVLERRRRQSPAPRRSHHQFAPQQIRLDLVDQRVGRKVHGVGHGLHAHRPADEYPGDRLQIFPVLGVEAQRVDALHFQGIAGHRQADLAVGSGSGRSRAPSASRLLANRGVPRLRPAISTAALSTISTRNFFALRRTISANSSTV